MQLQVTHTTRYNYQPAVETAQHMAYVRPIDHAGQALLSHSMEVMPFPAQMRCTSDVYRNTRCFFSLQEPHSVLEVQAKSLVTTYPSDIPNSQVPWEQQRDSMRFQAHAPYEPASEFVFASPFVPRLQEFAAYARPSFTPGASVLEVAVSVMERIYKDFTYESLSTQINTPALQALEQRKGVCQDFAHIMLACLRTMGLPARYVSGYLLTRPAPGTVKLVGSDASHAWVSVYVADLPEGARWVDLDPTNNRWGWYAPGVDYVTLAVGRDFGDVSPLRGVIHGGASHTLEVGVTVEEFTPTPAQLPALTPFAPMQPLQKTSQSQSQSRE
ncbi:transglutaminase family protein [Rhodoferax aquaticus]|uniref:Transglutaminase family protein n=1 Tax=Rhodoferax aquaticus TaxID=2527691 RepID=A0A515EN17_9BURK|nr:transglutaminase family protein [Rhodoferax aquaticus]QDL54032.1 transglutaminase family protein [Rhodoferax aquaticus]